MQFRSHFAPVVAAAFFGLTTTNVCADGFDHGSLKDGFAPQAVNWSGLYVGGVAAHAWADSKHCDDLTCGLPGVTYPEFDVDGWLGGFTVGYNVQWSNVVFGVEGDWSWGDMSGSSGSTSGFGCITTCNTDIDSIGTIRARLGVAYDRWLAYGTAGVAFVDQSASIGGVTAQDSSTETVFTAGGGFEYAFDRNWSGKAEYLYIDDSGDFAYDSGAGCGAPPGNCFARTTHIDLLRIGLNYKF